MPRKKHMKVYRLHEKDKGETRRDSKKGRRNQRGSLKEIPNGGTGGRDERVRSVRESRSEEEIERCIGSGPRASRSYNYRFNRYANGPSVTR